MPEYSSGATLAAGACLNALVMPHCPMAPVTATPADDQVVLPVNGLPARARATSAPSRPTASMQVIQNTIDCVVSVRPMIFTRTDDNA